MDLEIGGNRDDFTMFSYIAKAATHWSLRSIILKFFFSCKEDLQKCKDEIGSTKVSFVNVNFQMFLFVHVQMQCIRASKRTFMVFMVLITAKVWSVSSQDSFVSFKELSAYHFSFTLRLCSDFGHTLVYQRSWVRSIGPAVLV